MLGGTADGATALNTVEAYSPSLTIGDNGRSANVNAKFK
jgi:hypothetical protein